MRVFHSKGAYRANANGRQKFRPGIQGQSVARRGNRAARASAAGGDCVPGISRGRGGREFSSNLSFGRGRKLRAGKCEWLGAGGRLEPRRSRGERGEDGRE